MTPPSPPSPTGRFNGLAVALAILALLIAALLIGRFYFGPQHVRHEAAATGIGGSDTSIGGPFTLTDQDGRIVTEQDFRGKYLLVYFGFTFCPDVCPTSLQRNADALDLLGERARDIVPVLITVDPARDTPEKLKDYVHLFRPGLVGLTGTPEQVAAVSKAYRVYYAKVDPAKTGGDDRMYMMDHSSLTYLMGPDGRFLQFFRHDLSSEEMAIRLSRTMGGR